MRPTPPTPPAGTARDAATPGLWEILVDTGGTFTDCLGRGPDGRWRRAKVLSTGAVRATLKAKANAHELVVELPPGDWPEDFFAGFKVAPATGISHALGVAGFSTAKKYCGWWSKFQPIGKREGC